MIQKSKNLERWRTIASYEGFYEVSDQGRVKSLPRTVRTGFGTRRARGRIRKLVPDEDGYQTLVLSREHTVFCAKVHRLVLETFVGRCPDGMETRHLDGNQANNRLSNLAWGTSVENEEDKRRLGFSQNGESNPNAKMTWPIVRQIRCRQASGESQRNIAHDLGVSEANVSRIVRRLYWWPDPEVMA